MHMSRVIFIQWCENSIFCGKVPFELFWNVIAFEISNFKLIEQLTFLLSSSQGYNLGSDFPYSWWTCDSTILCNLGTILLEILITLFFFFIILYTLGMGGKMLSSHPPMLHPEECSFFFFYTLNFCAKFYLKKAIYSHKVIIQFKNHLNQCPLRKIV